MLRSYNGQFVAYHMQIQFVITSAKNNDCAPDNIEEFSNYILVLGLSSLKMPYL